MVGIGVFILPVVFVWLLLRRGYSMRARVAGGVWLGLCVGTLAALAFLPDTILAHTILAELKARVVSAASAAASAPATSIEDPPAGLRRAQTSDTPMEAAVMLTTPAATLSTTPMPLSFTLGKTTAIYRMLRTPVTLTNNGGADLRYAEIDCAFYDAKGGLLGNGMANWVSVKQGATVSGEVVAAGIDLSKVSRQACTTQMARPTNKPAAARTPPPLPVRADEGGPWIPPVVASTVTPTMAND